MFVWLLQLQDSIANQRIYLFVVFMGLVWVNWMWRLMLSRRYRPARASFSPTTSVVIPVVDEPVDLFRGVLRRIMAQEPTEVIVVINGPRTEVLEAVCEEFEGLRWLWTSRAGKRNAVRLGVEDATGDVVVLVDSDTVWVPDTLPELVKPFADPEVGGVTTKQRILAHDRHILTRWADWMESLRNEYSMPAMSVLGTVGCLPGRTIAFRRHILMRAMDHFMNARFLGVFLEVSDDRTLTNETLKQGYRTVFQSTSLVYTDAPTNWAKMARQQFRWARGSQYNTMRMLPWMVRRAPTLCFFYVSDILIPFLLLGTLTGWAYRALTGTQVDLYGGWVLEYGRQGAVATIAVTMLAATMLAAALRQSRHLAQRPSDFWRIPVFLAISTVMLMPIRMLGFVRMAHASGWGTRAGGYAGERERNPQIAIPYVLAAGFVVAGTLVHGL